MLGRQLIPVRNNQVTDLTSTDPDSAVAAGTLRRGTLPAGYTTPAAPQLLRPSLGTGRSRYSDLSKEKLCPVVRSKKRAQLQSH